MQRSATSSSLKSAIAAIAAAAGLVCSAASAQPINNFCDSPVNITTTGSVAFSTVNASTDGPSIPGCAAGTIFNDAWFCFTAPSTGLFAASTCGGTGLDTVLAVYQGCGCLALSSAALGCNDDFCNTQSRVEFFAVSGQRYTIRIGGYSDSSYGAGVLTISGPPTVVGNDGCAGAAGLFLDQAAAFNLAQATTSNSSDLAPVACTTTGQIFNDQWFSFVAPFAGPFVASTCSQTGADTVIATYNQCPGSSTQPLSCNDDACGLQSAAVFSAAAGQTIYIRLGGYSAGERGSGTLTVSSMIAGGPAVGPDGHQYYILAPMRWTEASSAATAMGGYLAEVGSQAESNFILSSVLPLADPAPAAAWIGLRRQVGNPPYPAWSNGTPVTFSRWGFGTPAATRATGFVALMAGSGLWLEFDDETYSIRPYAIVEVAPSAPACIADVASDGSDLTRNPNGSIGSEDVEAFVNAFISENASVADVASDPSDASYNPNGAVGSEDLEAFVNSLISGC